jgi:ElaB/YqjD/DUF883 family membrane-anchored ribosome-binding protein
MPELFLHGDGGELHRAAPTPINYFQRRARMSDLNEDLVESRERIAADFEALLDDTENLLRAVAGAGGETVKTARNRIQDRIADLKRVVGDGQDGAMHEMRAAAKEVRGAAKKADRYVHQNPWPAIGGALLVGIGLGLLGRRVPALAGALAGLD